MKLVFAVIRRYRRSLAALILSSIALLLPAVSTVMAQQRPIGVYLVPASAASEFKDADSQRLADSHADVLKFLAKQREWVVVDSKDGADIVLELVSAKSEDTGKTSTARNLVFIPGIPSTSATTTPILLNTVRLKMTAGTYEHEFMGRGLWRGAALQTILEVRKWVKINKAQLLAKRG